MKPPIVFFDCDGVLVNEPVWPKLHWALKMPEELDQKWCDAYYAGELKYDHWAKNVMDFYRKQKLNKKLFEEVLSDIKLNPEAFQIMEYLKKEKFITAIISSGIDFYIEKVAKILGTDYWRANATFHFRKNGLFSHWDYFGEDPVIKVMQIGEICEDLKIKPTETIFVGDSDNDLKAFEKTRHGVLYKGKNPDHKKFAWKVINNLMEIKDIIETI